MKVVKVIITFLLVFTFLFAGRQQLVLGQYTSGQIQTPANGWSQDPLTGAYTYSPPTGCPAQGCTGSPTSQYSNQTFAGYYQGNNGLYYPIGVSGNGSGPANTGGACTGVYGSCSAWTACSQTCGPGTQTQACYDTGCGTQQINTQSCQVNDPNVWGSWSICTMNCGTGTQSRTNQCGTVATQNCNTQTCGPWVKLKNTSFFSGSSLTDLIPPAPVAYDSDDTTQPYLIVGNDGVVAAPSISIDTSNVSKTTYTGNPEYKALYTPGPYVKRQR